MDFIKEIGEVPVEFSGDVIVAGAGVSGVFAALAAGRRGKKTLLIDRFGSPGGNMGPGYIAGGSLSGWPILHMQKGPFFGLPKEFIERHAALGGGSVPPYAESLYPRDVNIASHVLMQMLEEAGVILWLSTFVGDPILESNSVKGVFVENKSGRRAALAKVVVDATGEADLSRRAGAPVLFPEKSSDEGDAHAPTGMGLWYMLCGVNWGEYDEFKRTAAPVSDDDIRWAEDVVGRRPPDHLIRLIRKAWERGDFQVIREIDGLGAIGYHREIGKLSGSGGLAGSMFNLKTPWIDAATQGRVDAADGFQLSRLEAELRMYIFDLSRFWRDYVPGFGSSYLSIIAPFLGSRGGPCVEGDYVMTREDLESGRRFPDVMYVFDHVGGRGDSAFEGNWTDLPFRATLPKGLEGLLAAGRCASCRPDTLLRSRSMVMHMGEAVGTAAALSVEQSVSPRELTVKSLQEALLEAGYYLGDRRRLEELGLT